MCSCGNVVDMGLIDFSISVWRQVRDFHESLQSDFLQIDLINLVNNGSKHDETVLGGDQRHWQEVILLSQVVAALRVSRCI